MRQEDASVSHISLFKGLPTFRYPEQIHGSTGDKHAKYRSVWTLLEKRNIDLMDELVGWVYICTIVYSTQ